MKSQIKYFIKLNYVAIRFYLQLNFVIFILSTWIEEACDHARWSNSSLEYSASIISIHARWSKSPCHRWGISEWYHRVFHYDMPPNVLNEWGFHW